jgi:hypothetical protein
MESTVITISGLAVSAVAFLCAVAALLRSGSVAKPLPVLSTPTPTLDNSDQVRRDLVVRIDLIDEQVIAMARQFDTLQLSVSQLRLGRDVSLAAPEKEQAALPYVSFKPGPVFEPAAEPDPKVALSPLPAPVTVPTMVPEGPLAATPERYTDSRVEELVAGYRAKIAERSKAPIREWLSQNNSFTLEAAEDGSLVPSESGVIAAILIGDGLAVLVPTASFVVDFATRFAGSQISLRQVMRNTFEAVADNSGDMKLQAPAIAISEGERWIVKKPGRLGGFTDK